MGATSLGFLRVKVVALAVTDEERAHEFYGTTLGLPPAFIDGEKVGYELENTILMLKPVAEWYGKPTLELNARITLQVSDAAETEAALHQLGVAVSDAVADNDGHLGAFLDSEGNKIWFCSTSG